MGPSGTGVGVMAPAAGVVRAVSVGLGVGVFFFFRESTCAPSGMPASSDMASSVSSTAVSRASALRPVHFML